MLTPEQFNQLLSVFPVLQAADPRLKDEFQSTAFFARIPAGQDVFVEGDQAEAIALLVSGAVRVYKIGETGREITLYRFGHGQSCILTANAILSSQSFPAIATVESDAEAVMVPAQAFRGWVKRYDVWRDFVWDLLSERLSKMLTVIDEVVFQRMDRRLAAWLLKEAVRGNPLHVTHQEIAADLGSSREVISRLLEDFSHEGLLAVGRGTVEVLDFENLESKAFM